MKYLLLFLPTFAFGQVYWEDYPMLNETGTIDTMPTTLQWPRYAESEVLRVISRGESRGNPVWETHTEVLHDPLVVCYHDWVSNRENAPLFQTCAVLHDACGCPYVWLNHRKICRKCLMHVHEWMTCNVVYPPKEESYEEVLERSKR